MTHHILHQERIVKIGQIRTEEIASLCKGMHTSLNQEFRKDRINSKFRRKLSDDLLISNSTHFPYLFNSHNTQRYGFF